MERFCDRLNEAIERAELSPAELSRRTGIGEGAISCWGYRGEEEKGDPEKMRSRPTTSSSSVQHTMTITLQRL